MIEFFADVYKEENWTAYANCFENVNIHIDGIPQDIVNAVVGLLGDDTGYNWLHTPLHQFKKCIRFVKNKKRRASIKSFYYATAYLGKSRRQECNFDSNSAF